LVKIGGGSLLMNHKNSRLQLLQNAYPEYNWLPWKFDVLPHKFFDNVNNQRKFMEWAGKELKIKEMSDWYKITNKDMFSVGGFTLCKRYKFAVPSLLVTVFTEYKWLPWKFENKQKSTTSTNYWEGVNNQRKFMELARKELNIQTMDDWYKVSIMVTKIEIFKLKMKDWREIDRWGLLSQYEDSLYQLLVAMYPEHDWLPWRFALVPRIFWDDAKNQRKVLEWAGKQLGVKQFSDWYEITVKVRLFSSFKLKINRN
jgi:hypothetical protein